MNEIEWTKQGIINWMEEVDVFKGRNYNERQKLVNFFTDEANKHMDTKEDRVLYRKALGVVESGKKEKQYRKFMEL